MSFIPDSANTVRVFLEAEDIAARTHQNLSSAHLLLAIFTFTNRAQTFLTDHDITEDRILLELRVMEDEPRNSVQNIRNKARELARGSCSSEVDNLHLLISITRMSEVFAFKLLKQTSPSLGKLRNLAMSYVTGNLPKRLRDLPKTNPHPGTLVNRRPMRASTQIIQSKTRTAPTRTQPSISRAPKVVEDEFEAVAAAVEAAGESAKKTTPQKKQTKTQTRVASQQLQTLEEMAPTLAASAIDFTDLARRGELDFSIGREKELEALVDILGKRRANNPILVGPPGVGKTAIVEGLAVKIARNDPDVQHFKNRIIASMDTGALEAGTSLRGAFSERMGNIKKEVAENKEKIIVFIDEIHTLIGAGTSGDGPQDAANELKTALARGDFPCVGATTHDEFKKYIEKDPALERRFTPIFVEEPDPDEALLILEGAIGPYAAHHKVEYTWDAVQSAVNLSHRFITERKLPDKAFSVVDLAGSRAQRRGAEVVTRMDIARIIHELSGVPIERLADADADRLNKAEEIISQKVVGHKKVIASTARAVRRGFAGFNSNRPIASLLFLGPTGVGKTELAKVLAEFLFGRKDAMIRIDMSEFSEQHSVSRLLGAQPGYVGYEEGGQLTEALRRRPFQIVVFDEIEKAHKDVLNILLQILDEGQLTDSRGRRISFANTVVILTSNLGAEEFGKKKGGIGFSSSDDDETNLTAVIEAARNRVAPELWGRIDERLVFEPLDRDQVREIAVLQLRESSQTLFAEREISLDWDDDVLDFLLNHGGFTPETGARGMRQTIQRHIEASVAEQILAGDFAAGDIIEIRTTDDKILFEKGLSAA